MNLLSDPKKRIGLAITAVGLLLAFLSVTYMGWLLIIVAGLVLASLGLFRKESLWLLPGCLLIGIGLATFVTFDGLMEVDVGKKGGVFVLVASLGWFLATFLSKRTSGRLLMWTIIPGTLMILLGYIAFFNEILYIPLAIIRSYWAYTVVSIGLFIFTQDLFQSETHASHQDLDDIDELPKA